MILRIAGVALLVVPFVFGGVQSPVADAAMNGDKTALRSLLKSRADINASQADGATAIQWAAYKNDLEMADLLIAAGANVKAANHDGATALYLASIAGSAPMMDKLLKAGADVNERGPEGETPIMLAARNGRVDALKVLLEHKADVNATDTLRGTTALMWAAEQGHPEAVKLLIEHGASVSAASAFDTRGGKAYLADTISARLNSASGAKGQQALKTGVNVEKLQAEADERARRPLSAGKRTRMAAP